MNPEFRRQLWLGFSVTRLAVLPLLLLACFAVAFLSTPDNVATVLAITGAAMFAVLVWGMGTLAAGSSVMDEITERTWDQQRMSAMQPWAMTWGKLGGATAYGWYGGALCLLVAAPAALWSGLGDKVLQTALMAVLLGLFLQALLIAFNLQLVKNGGHQASRGGIWLLVVGLLWGAAPLFGLSREPSVTWWGQPFGSLNFSLASMALCAVGALVAAWRSMAEVLAVRQLPWGWPTLAALLAVYLSGFASAHHAATLAVVGVASCAALTYLALLTEPQPRPMWQRVVTRLAGGQWRAAWLQLPRWPTTLLLAVPFVLAASLALNPLEGPVWPELQHIKLYPATFLLLVVRDCALALFFAFAVKNRRAVTSFLLAMFALYVLLPWLLGAVGGNMLASLVQPLLAGSGLSFVVALMHAALALGLLGWRWRATAPLKGAL